MSEEPNGKIYRVWKILRCYACCMSLQREKDRRREIEFEFAERYEEK
jgi:hypothetical protein